MNTKIAAVGIILSFTSLAHADESPVPEGTEIVEFTSHAHREVRPAPAAVSHVQTCDGRMVTCGAPQELAQSPRKVGK